MLRAYQVIIVCVIAALAGCATSPPTTEAPPPTAAPGPTTAPPPPEPGDGCRDATDRAVRFARADGGRLGGVLFGAATGDVGVVLGHEHPMDLCTWAPYARKLAARGYRVLALDFSTYGSSEGVTPLNLVADVTAAALYLRGRGAKRIVLMGASMGGTAVVAAAPAVASTVAVVSLSGPTSFLGAEGLPAAGRLRVPLLCAAATQDMGGDFLAAARRLCATAGAAGPRELVTVAGAGHGTQLVALPTAPASVAIDRLLARYARP